MRLEASESEARCSFCGKDARQGVRLVAGRLPGTPAGKFGQDARICEECLDLCLSILAENTSPQPTGRLRSGQAEEPTEHQRQRDLRRRRTPTLRTLAITQNLTVDGSIEILGDWSKWATQRGVSSGCAPSSAASAQSSARKQASASPAAA